MQRHAQSICMLRTVCSIECSHAREQPYCKLIVFAQRTIPSIHCELKMGIDIEIRKQMRQTWTPHLFQAFVPQSQARMVLIDDIMTRMFMAKGPNPDHTFTGAEFYDEVMKAVRKCLWGPCYYAYVIVADNKSNVPKEKAEEQARRSQARKIEPVSQPLCSKIDFTTLF